MHLRFHNAYHSLIALALAAGAPHASAHADEEQHPVLPTLANTTLSGFVNTTALWNWQIAGQPVDVSVGSFTPDQPALVHSTPAILERSPDTANSAAFWKWTAPADGTLAIYPDNTFGRWIINVTLVAGAQPGPIADNIHRFFTGEPGLPNGLYRRPAGDLLVPVSRGAEYQIRTSTPEELLRPWDARPNAANPSRAVALFVPTPANSSPLSAAPLPNSASFQVLANNLGASKESPFAPIPASTNGVAWYQWTAPHAGRVEVSTAAINAPPAALVSITQPDLPPPNFQRPDAIPAGWEVWVVPPNFVLPPGLVLIYSPPIENGNGNGNSDNRIDITPPFLVDLGVDLDATPPFTPFFAAFRGTSISADSLASVGRLLQFRTQAGELFSIAVGSETPTPGVAALHLRLVAPDNDLFANRRRLSGASGIFQYHLIGAGLETGEPPSVNGAGGSGWWSWTAPETGVLTFSAVDLANTNSPVGAARLSAFAGETWERLTFLQRATDTLSLRVDAGKTYSFAVDSDRSDLPAYAWKWDLQRLAPTLSASIIRHESWTGCRIELAPLYGQDLKLSTSTDLKTWTPLWQGVFGGETGVLKDFSGVSAAPRFYRLEIP